MKQDEIKAQNKAVISNHVIPLRDMTEGTRNEIKRLLGITLSCGRVNEIMDKTDTLIELCVDLGMELQRCGCSEKVRVNLYHARTKRANEV